QTLPRTRRTSPGRRGRRESADRKVTIDIEVYALPDHADARALCRLNPNEFDAQASAHPEGTRRSLAAAKAELECDLGAKKLAWVNARVQRTYSFPEWLNYDA